MCLCICDIRFRIDPFSCCALNSEPNLCETCSPAHVFLHGVGVDERDAAEWRTFAPRMLEGLGLLRLPIAGGPCNAPLRRGASSTRPSCGSPMRSEGLDG